MPHALAKRRPCVLEEGDHAPPTHGLSPDNAFASLEHQLGRAAIVLVARDLSAPEPAAWRRELEARRDEFDERQCDLIALLETPSAHAWAYAFAPQAGVRMLSCDSATIDRWGADAPYLVALDRAGRIVRVVDASDPAEGAAQALAAVDSLPRETEREDPVPAPILVIPQVFSRDLCRALIAHFEASRFEVGGMAGRDAEGRLYHKIDEAKKKRFDFVLGPGDPMLAPALSGVIRRVLPEVKKAFQVDVRHTDRLLLARYDEGGFFRRHRDNAAPGLEFRQFALSVNLNSDDFEGGDVMFPEYNLRRYKPPTGGAVVFSCSLLHEATPVTKGRRYALLTFMHDAAAQARSLKISSAA